jgi:hypothetical protein
MKCKNIFLLSMPLGEEIQVALSLQPLAQECPEWHKQPEVSEPERDADNKFSLI